MARVPRYKKRAKQKRKRSGKNRHGRTLEERHRLLLTPTSRQQRIIELFKSGQTSYLNISNELNLDIESVVDICKSLMRQGKITIAKEGKSVCTSVR